MMVRYIDVFDADLAKRAWEYTSHEAHWQYGTISAQHDASIWYAEIMGTPILQELWASLDKSLGGEYSLIFASANGQTIMQHAAFHKDAYDNVTHSFIWFANPNWQHNWGGRLIICGEDRVNEWSVAPIPNSGVLIDANMLHSAEAPNVKNELRVSIAFKMAKVK
jgi:hypothetical protein